MRTTSEESEQASLMGRLGPRFENGIHHTEKASRLKQGLEPTHHELAAYLGQKIDHI